MRCITVRMSLSASLIELRREWWWWCTLRRGSLNRRRPQRSRDISSRSLCAMSLSHDYTIIALGSANIISIQQKPRSRRRHHRMIPIKGATLGYIYRLPATHDDAISFYYRFNAKYPLYTISLTD